MECLKNVFRKTDNQWFTLDSCQRKTLDHWVSMRHRKKGVREGENFTKFKYHCLKLNMVDRNVVSRETYSVMCHHPLPKYNDH